MIEEMIFYWGAAADAATQHREIALKCVLGCALKKTFVLC